MLKRLSLAFLSLFLTLQMPAFTQFSLGDDSCSEALHLFSKHRPLIHPRALEIIKKHPISKLAASLEARSQFIEFDVHRSDEQMSVSNQGERIQGSMLKQLAARIFAKANDPYAEIFTIEIRPFDEAEFLGASDPDHISMSLLKSANPQSYSISREKQRDAYGIDASEEVMSLYMQELDPTDESKTNPDLTRIFTSMDTPRIVFLTASLNVDFELAEDYIEGHVEDSGYRVVSLSDLISKKAKIEGKTVVFNNVVGSMKEILSLSNYAMVVGAVNFFEPLVRQLPVILFSNHNAIGGYESKKFDAMKMTGQATGGLIPVTNVSGLSSALEAARSINNNVIQHPAFVIPKGQKKSAFELLLDDLQKRVEEQAVWP